jgi:tRNA-dihydrouridine synthase
MEKLFDFADMLVEEGVSQIVLHPRTKKEKYTRPPKYNLLNEFCQYVKENHAGVSVIGNGGVRDVASYRKLLSVAPTLDGIMIGRAAVEKPWIFAELKKSEKVFEGTGEELETEIDLYQVAEGFLEDLCQFQPKEFYPTRAKRFFEYFIDNFFFGHSLKAKIQNTDEKSEQLQLLKEYLERNPQERYKRVRV